MARLDTSSESQILGRVISAKVGGFGREVVRSFLEFKFSDREMARIRRLLRKNRSGTITASERISLEKYLQIGQFLDILHAHARALLAKRPRTG